MWTSAAPPLCAVTERRLVGFLKNPASPWDVRQCFVRYAAWLKEIEAESHDTVCDQAIDLVLLGERKSLRLGSLSGGQRRRAALAAASVGNPGLMLLDEPTTGIDPIQRLHLLNQIRLMSEMGQTVLMATHLLEDVAIAADRWLAMDEGKLVASGAVDRTSQDSALRSVQRVRDVLAGTET